MMRHSHRPVALLLLLSACGGHSEKSSAAPDSPTPTLQVGGEAGSDSSESAAGALGDPFGGGAGSVAPGGAASQGMGEAGAASDPLIESGTRACENSEYCFGLSCYAPPAFAPSICLRRCETNFDCGQGESCLSNAKLEPTCFQRCGSPSDCAYRFDCYDFNRDGQLMCIPAAWAAELGN